jgi:hypothetical protein
VKYLTLAEGQTDFVTTGPLFPGQENPHGLKSLWNMLQRYAFGFYEVVCRLESLREQARIHRSPSGTLYEYSREDLLKNLREMRTECDVLALSHTSGLTSFFETKIVQKNKDYTYGDLLNDLDTLSYNFSNELSERVFFRVENKKLEYFQKKDLFGEKVAVAFPSCISEIESAGNCYALEENEASVFHLMRVLERGLGALAVKFAVDFKHTNWDNVIGQIESKIKKMDSSLGLDWKEQQRFCSQAATQFRFLKDAWRNHVMHVSNVPYDAGRAFSILVHVGEVMQALAEGGLKE